MEARCFASALLLPLLFAASASAAAWEQIQWRNCGSAEDPIRLKELSVRPYPVQIKPESSIHGFASGSVGRSFGAAQLQLKMFRQLFGMWIAIPCISGIGSCAYPNGCELARSLVEGGQSPAQCSVRAQEFDVAKDFRIGQIPDHLVWLVAGTYKVEVELIENATSSRIGCVEVVVRIV